MQLKLGLLGGTFDPIHTGHLLIAQVTQDALQLDRVLFVPAGNPPHKQGQPTTTATHRQKMVELALADNPGFELCTVDLDRPGPHFSVDMLAIVRARYHLTPDDIFFIIGGDSLADLPGWHQPAQLIRACRLVALHRPGYQPDVRDIEQELPGLSARLTWLPSPMIDLASSHIRAAIAQGRSIRYQVPEAVRVYIEQNKLYRDQ
jgi:nicotinate-nucleotide adenylyltransferase